MSNGTYNPIGQVYTQPPALEAGSKLVAMRDGIWVEASAIKDSITERLFEYVTRRVLIVTGLALAIFIYFFGLGGLLFTAVAAIGFVIFLNLQRTNQISLLFLGAPTQYHLVNVSRHTIRTEHDVQLGETVKKIKITLQFTASVADAAGVVNEGITDARNAIEQKLFRAVQIIAKNATLTDELKGLRESLREFSDDEFSDNLFTISDMTYELTIDPETTLWLENITTEDLKRDQRERELREEQHKAEVEAKKIRAQQGVYLAQKAERDLERKEFGEISSSEDNLRRELLRPDANREAIHDELNRRLEDESQTFQQKIDLLRFLIKEGALESHEIQMKYPGFSEALLADVAQNITSSDSKVQLTEPTATNDKSLTEQGDEHNIEARESKNSS